MNDQNHLEMANAEQLKILEAGRAVWNTWEEENKNEIIDLSGSDLSCLDLSGFHLPDADLSRATFFMTKLEDASLIGARLFDTNFFRATLERANLSMANIEGANFSKSNLEGANFSESNLEGANFSFANLNNAILEGANLSEVNFFCATLANVNFSQCRFGFNVFGLTDLSTCQGLDSVGIKNPCTIDFQTLRTSKNLPKSFLLKIGLPEHYIDYLPDFFGDSYLFPAFLSHSWKNKPFVRNLYEALIGKGVNVFLDEKKMKPGDDLYESISKGIQDYDKMILVCSKESLTESWWVDRELDRVFAKERELQKKHGKRIDLLIPIRLDDYIFEWKGVKAEEVRRYNIGDFRPEADFEKSLNDLVHALRVERPDVKPPSNY